jgi:hypothetical protein
MESGDFELELAEMVGGPGLEPGWVSPHAPQTWGSVTLAQSNCLTNTSVEFISYCAENLSCELLLLVVLIAKPRDSSSLTRAQGGGEEPSASFWSGRARGALDRGDIGGGVEEIAGLAGCAHHEARYYHR